MKSDYRYTLHSCYLGYITQAIVNNLAPLLFVIFRERFGLSLEMVGRLILVNFVTQIAVDFIAVRWADRIGYRVSVILAHGFAAAGLIGIGVLPLLIPSPYLALSIAVVLYAIGGGLIEVLISPIVDSLPGDAKASAMSLLHSFYCWGQVTVVLITTVLLGILGTAFWPAIAALWAIIPLYNLIRFTRSPLVPPVADHEKTPLRELFGARAFLIALVLMVSAGASELTISQWSSFFAEKGLGVPKLLGDILGPCLFAVLMGTARALYGFYGHRIALKGALLASAALCVLCYLVTIFAPWPILSLAGCALCGFSVALMWPGSLSLTAAAFPKGGTAMFGLLAVAGDLGAATGPWLAGFTADFATGIREGAAGAANGLKAAALSETWGLKVGLLAAIIFPILLFAGVASLRRRPRGSIG